MMIHEKIFNERYPEKKFFDYEIHINENSRVIREQLIQNFGFRRDFNTLDFSKLMIEKGRMVVENFDETNFDISRFIPSQNCETIFCSYDNMETIYEIKLLDFVSFFSDIFFPAADDLDVFSFDLDWIIFLTHENECIVTKL